MPFSRRALTMAVSVHLAALLKLTHEMQSVALIEDQHEQERQDWS